MLSFLCNHFLIGQDSPEVEMMNQVSAKRRIELNKADSVFINKTLVNVKNCNCLNIDSIINTHKYSNILVYELVKQAIQDDTICNRVILNNILYFEEHPKSMRYNDSNNFPVSQGIFSIDTNVVLLANYLLESNYLESCTILEERPRDFSIYLSNILKSKQELQNLEKMKCKTTNLESLLKD